MKAFAILFAVVGLVCAVAFVSDVSGKHEVERYLMIVGALVAGLWVGVGCSLWLLADIREAIRERRDISNK